MKRAQHIAEYMLAKCLFGIFRLLPLDAASHLGGLLARTIGPFMRAHKIAQRNLAIILPHLSAGEKQTILRSMWDNLGRNAAELPFLPGKKLTARLRCHGLEHLPKPGEQALFFSGHVGNWELLGSAAFDHGVPLSLIYRRANNSFIDALIARYRLSHCLDLIPKGHRGAVKLVRALKAKESVAMLIDQKMNDGISVPFFGIDAMTAPAIAQLALRYNLPIIPAKVVRTHGAHFDAIIYPPLHFEKTGDMDKDVAAIMTHVNSMLEAWIRERPEQWFWVHKRWPS